MAFIKYALSALVAANAVMAADCGNGKSITISSQSDADGIGSCKTYKGDVEVGEHYSGDLTLNSVQQITGAFKAVGGANVSSIQAPELSSIENEFKLNGLTTLTKLSMGSLTSVGSIEWTALPNLQTLDFPKGVTKASEVSITNTGLTNLDGIKLKEVGRFDVTENTSLKKVNVNNLKNATGLINFAGNMDSLEIELPNLEGATNMTFRNVSAASFPSLEKLTGQLGFWGDKFETFSAPNLTETGDLVFNDNNKLKNISMPQLKTVVGGFQISRNDKLSEINFPKLEQVTGAIDFSGAFDEASLPALENVKGGFNMQSTGNFSCSTFDKMHSNKVIRGTYKCHGDLEHPKTKDGKSGSSSTGSSSGASSTGSASASMMNVVDMPAMGMAAVFGALLQFVM